jgi:hypothetical protein
MSSSFFYLFVRWGLPIKEALGFGTIVRRPSRRSVICVALHVVCLKVSFWTGVNGKGTVKIKVSGTGCQGGIMDLGKELGTLKIGIFGIGVSFECFLGQNFFSGG